MGDHRPGCVATACQTVHERGCVPGRAAQRKNLSFPNPVFRACETFACFDWSVHASCCP